MKASGLKPIVIDEDSNIEELVRKTHETNVEFVTRIMTRGCPTGPLIQLFVIEAVGRYAKQVSASDGATWPEDHLVSFESWKATADWLQGEFAKKYS